MRKKELKKQLSFLASVVVTRESKCSKQQRIEFIIHKLEISISNDIDCRPQVYWAGPIIGGVVAALLYQKAFRARSAEEEEELKRQDEQQQHHYAPANAKEIEILGEVIADRTTTI